MRNSQRNTVINRGGSYFLDNSRPATEQRDLEKPHSPKVIKIISNRPEAVKHVPNDDTRDTRQKPRPPGYNSWSAMKQRIDNPNHHHFADYGGRGITYDHHWQLFERFISQMGPPPGRGYSLERKDVNGNYCQSNCVWANAKQQARNRRSNRLIEDNGNERTLSELAEENGLSPSTLSARLARGLTVEQAISTPVKHGGVPHIQPGDDFDKWPSTLPDQSKAMLDAGYLQRANHTESRPAYFMRQFEDQYSNAVGALSANPDEVPDHTLEKANRLVDVYQEAQSLSAQMRLQRISVSQRRCPCCGQNVRRM
jgi:hypothetical protein